MVVCLTNSEASTVSMPWHTISCSTERNKLLRVKYKTARYLILEVSIILPNSSFFRTYKPKSYPSFSIARIIVNQSLVWVT
jgi:hypothetical protein